MRDDGLDQGNSNRAEAEILKSGYIFEGRACFS